MTRVRFSRPGTSLLFWLLLVGFGVSKAQQGGGAPAGGRKTAKADARPDEASPFRITGRMISSVSKVPVGGAAITVSPMGARRRNGRFAGRGGGQTAVTIADAEGRFAVEVPSAGGWSLSASARGYHTQSFEEHGDYSTAIVLTEAKPAHEVTFQLTPAAAIEGYVLDEAGEAVRNAQLTVSLIPAATPDDQHPRRQARGSQRTDDRGYYKFAGLLAGNYDVKVKAQPWYAKNGPSGAGSGKGASALDPLDVVYPVVWFPGVPDYAMATPVALRGGETKEADFRLSPEPGFHLRIGGSDAALPVDSEERVSAGYGLRNGASLRQVLPDGTEGAVPLQTRMEKNGATEFSGLAPGTYVIRRQGEGDSLSTSTIRVAENSVRTLDVSQAVPAVPVTVTIDAAGEAPPLQVSFREAESGRIIFLQGGQEFGRGGQRRGWATDEFTESKKGEGPPERTVSLPAGRYEVVLTGNNEFHLTSIEAKGATAVGRTVTITGGAPTLILHVAHGRADVAGVVEARGEPMQGAMVLLVPATLGDPAGLEIVRRDQSNTDGSFDMSGVLPGKYILVAIDHGWDVNWIDPATLRRFLMHGLPLDLSAGGDTKKTVEAQSP